LHSGPALPTSKRPSLGAALICCAACTAPITDMRPPCALVREDRQFEAGGGAAMVTPRPYVIESSHGEGQLWFTDRVVPWLSLSGVVAFDANSPKAGVAGLARYVTTDRFIAGVGAEAGYAWYAGSLSAAGRLFDDTWIYVAPRIYNWGIYATPGIPAGITARVYRGFHLRAEAQLSWQEFKYYNRRLHLSAAAVYEW
jgi:hypothetical protein